MQQSKIKTWSDLVRETRSRLGLTRNEFAEVLGISIHTLADWEYRNTVPHKIYQELMVNLYNNHLEVKAKLDANKSQKKPTTNNNDNFWLGVLTGAIGAGIVGIVGGLIASSAKESKNVKQT